MGVTCGLNIQLGWFLGNEAAVASVNEPHSAGTEAVTLVGKGRYQMMFYQHVANGFSKTGLGSLTLMPDASAKTESAIAAIHSTIIATKPSDRIMVCTGAVAPSLERRKSGARKR
jgi:hypothetical protein